MEDRYIKLIKKQDATYDGTATEKMTQANRDELEILEKRRLASKKKEGILTVIMDRVVSLFKKKKVAEKKKQKKPIYTGKKPYGLGTVDHYSSGGE